MTTLEKSYLTEQVASEARARISDTQTFGTTYYDPSDYIPPRESGTSHLAVVDSTGMAVSLTTTVNLIFGSQVSECMVFRTKQYRLAHPSSFPCDRNLPHPLQSLAHDC